MSGAGWVRNGLIFAGFVGASVFGVQGAMHEPETVEENNVSSTNGPIVVTASTRLAVGERLTLDAPLALDFPQGRNSLTGEDVQIIPTNPLLEFDVDRRFDSQINLPPPAITGELPPARASDEVQNDGNTTTSTSSTSRVDDLPDDVKTIATTGFAHLEEGNRLLVEGMDLIRTSGGGDKGSEKLRNAFAAFTMALDELSAALKRAPDNRALEAGVRDAREGRVAANKHRYN